jgi:hypothetical protein
VHFLSRMGSNSLPRHASTGIHSRPGERRRNLRFDMHFPVYLRVPGDPWTMAETVDLSAAGASFVTDHPFLLNQPLEYVLTFPPDLTKAQRSLRVRFFGSVLRCDRIGDAEGNFGVAVNNTGHRYLSSEESAVFDALDQKLASRVDAVTESKTGT